MLLNPDYRFAVERTSAEYRMETLRKALEKQQAREQQRQEQRKLEQAAKPLARATKLIKQQPFRLAALATPLFLGANWYLWSLNNYLPTLSALFGRWNA